ncbi:MAG: molybdopterin-dependent oxidoreductase [Deltaproteobacteria bacterium]|nr:molybdopterin-dependent oxidoreductase [Deltaproteobacteria bacterium]
MNHTNVLKVVGDDGSAHTSIPSPQEWRLKVSGEVENPRSFTLGELMALGDGPIRGRRHITCVSAGGIVPGGGAVEFGGVLFSDLCKEVRPLPGAEDSELPTVSFVSWAPGTVGPRSEPHRTTLPLADCFGAGGGIFLATELEGSPLPHCHGGPLRSVASEDLFFYKGIKWLQEIQFLPMPLESCRGTWEEHTGYHNRARVALGERFEPRMRRILSVEVDAQGNRDERTELIAENDWQTVFDEMHQQRDFSRLSVAQLHKMFGRLPSDFRNCRFSNGVFQAQIRGTSFASADFTGADLSEANFSLSKMTAVRFSSPGEEPAILRGADFEGAFFNNAHLRGVSMAGARLSNATFFAQQHFEKTTDRVQGLDVRGATHLDPKTAQWLQKNGALVDPRDLSP